MACIPRAICEGNQWTLIRPKSSGANEAINNVQPGQVYNLRFMRTLNVYGERSLELSHFTKTTDGTTDDGSSSGAIKKTYKYTVIDKMKESVPHNPGATSNSLLASLALPNANSSALNAILKNG